jgi:Flp pilus assembly pilin Flp
MPTTVIFLGAWLRARLQLDERGANLVEYALLVSFIFLVCVAAVAVLGDEASQSYESIGEGIQNEP